MNSLPLLLVLLLISFTACDIMPENTLNDCVAQCKDNKNPKACLEFCDCIHKEGKTLDSCLAAYNQAPMDSIDIRK